MTMFRKKWQVPLFCTLLIFGLLMSAQYNTQVAVLNSLASQSSEDLVTLVKQLNEKRIQLEQEVTGLEGTKRSLDQQAAADSTLVASLKNELKQLQVIDGNVPVHGPGIKITITQDSNLYYRDLIDLINELWASGAEAIAINEYRIMNNTVIYEAEDVNHNLIITLNNKPLLSPVIIKAVGHPDTLEKGLTFSGGIIDTLNIYQVFPVIKKQEDLVIPIASSHFSSKYLKR
ncbi:DUF881 domain-containing protein [Candidatus Formimonas warabiya]|uniref:DUF881 domain-containing protein n=1 Tax=Formimonas warabiya TaxID=1761012 RepID=A0A3G1KVZ3_FORW1|nr:DUF881 domain-containing protein [Candidatus Formimonas warabiya]ATW26385.1 hypothetical protein DCMF_17905 [Candidatus Formimonas warabiya]